MLEKILYILPKTTVPQIRSKPGVKFKRTFFRRENKNIELDTTKLQLKEMYSQKQNKIPITLKKSLWIMPFNCPTSSIHPIIF